MTRYLIAGVLLILVCYGSIKAWPLIAGPSLAVTSPNDNEAFPNGIVLIQGTSSRAATLSLNGAPLLHDEQGAFSSTLSFPHGGSILTFIATDRFGRRIITTRTIFVP